MPRRCAVPSCDREKNGGKSQGGTPFFKDKKKKVRGKNNSLGNYLEKGGGYGEKRSRDKSILPTEGVGLINQNVAKQEIPTRDLISFGLGGGGKKPVVSKVGGIGEKGRGAEDWKRLKKKQQ